MTGSMEFSIAMLDIFWLVVWNMNTMNFMTFHLLGIITPTDELIFFRGVETINQFWLIRSTYIGVFFKYFVFFWLKPNQHNQPSPWAWISLTKYSGIQHRALGFLFCERRWFVKFSDFIEIPDLVPCFFARLPSEGLRDLESARFWSSYSTRI